VLTSLAAAAASADDDDDNECRSFDIFIANKSRNYFPHIRNKVQHGVSNAVFVDDQGLFDVSYPVPNSSSAFRVSSPTVPSSAGGSEDINLCKLM